MSLKNFQIASSNENGAIKRQGEIIYSDILLQFGETNNQGEYIVDFKNPFSLLQAFSIGVIAIEN